MLFTKLKTIKQWKYK